LGGARVFAGLPIETVDERTVVLRPNGGGGIVKGQAGFTLTPGLRGAYPGHKIEFLGYEEDATASDPNRLIVTIRTARLTERESQTGGCSFPSRGGAIFTVETLDAASSPVAFTSPVNLTIQYKKRGDPVQGDVLRFGGWCGLEEAMAIAHDTQPGGLVHFDFCTSLPQTLDTVHQSVSIEGLVGLTGADGLGTWGVVCHDMETPAARWQLYR
jgi:hypothetical protein